MSSERVKELLTQLRDELETTPVDPETLALMRELDADIHDALAAKGAGHGLLDRARAVEVRFAVEHGVAERLLREIVDTLAKIGV